jgi:hypothetical protein
MEIFLAISFWILLIILLLSDNEISDPHTLRLIMDKKRALENLKDIKEDIKTSKI